uniref:Uncharacterized protein n=1 Tax=Cajanus cajan TaxID=3821 RepID=A0A151TBR7_CAJCA|nr:hypothetical protein KK1_019099 [Cajanus cajan]
MHLWPTKNLRDSFKLSYLKRLEWNYQRMQMQKDQKSSTEQKLLENENQDQNSGAAPNLLNCETGSVASLFHELLLLLSCCYCCFCCGGNSLAPYGSWFKFSLFCLFGCLIDMRELVLGSIGFMGCL